MSDQIEEPDVEIEGAETEAPPPEQIAIDPAITELKAQIEAEKAARLDAQRREREAMTRASTAQTETHATNVQLVATAIAKVEQDNALLRARFRDALAAGEYDQVADIQEAIAMNAANLLQLQQGKARMEAAGPPQKPVAAPDDPVEAMASQLGPRSAAWIRAHPDYARNPKLTNRMIAAHQLAVSDDLVPDSDEYFAAVEATLGIRAKSAPIQAEIEPKQQESPMSEASQPVQRRNSPPPAPVSRQSVPGRGNSETLNPLEAQIAADLGMTRKEYAENKRKLIAEGRMKA